MENGELMCERRSGVSVKPGRPRSNNNILDSAVNNLEKGSFLRLNQEVMKLSMDCTNERQVAFCPFMQMSCDLSDVTNQKNRPGSPLAPTSHTGKCSSQAFYTSLWLNAYSEMTSRDDEEVPVPSFRVMCECLHPL